MRKPALIAYSCVTWTLVALCLLMIFGFSAQDDVQSSRLSMEVTDVVLTLAAPNVPIDSTATSYQHMHTVVRKAGHASEYALLCALLLMVLAPKKRKLSKKLLLAVLCCFLYAVFDEFHQSFIQGRSAEVLDTLIDAAGAVLGALVALLARQLILMISRYDILQNAKKKE